MTEYPVEKYIELDNNPYLLGRITIHCIQDYFNAEVDIIYLETHKIFKHIDILYRLSSEEEAILNGVQALKKFLTSHSS